MDNQVIQKLITKIENCVQIDDQSIRIIDNDLLRNKIQILAETATFNTGEIQAYARYLIQLISAEAGIYPASIHEL